MYIESGVLLRDLVPNCRTDLVSRKAVAKILELQEWTVGY
jgi:hypothetical protein